MAVRKSGLSPNDKNVTNRIVEMLRAWNGEGRSSDEAVLTRAELREMLGGRVGQFSGAFREAIRRLSPGGDLAELYPDTQPPTQPVNAQVYASFGSILVVWAPPTYVGHSGTEVWRNTADVLGDAALVAFATGSMYSDVDAEPGVTYYYWVRHRNRLDKTGPWFATPGLEATVETPVGYLLQELTDQITEDQLYTDLNTRIDLIDTSPGNLISVQGELGGRLGVLEAEVADLSLTPDWSVDDSYSGGDLVKWEGALYRALAAITAPSPEPDDPAYWEKVGDYASLGEAVSAHAVLLDDHELRVTDNEGDIAAQAVTVTALQSGLDDVESDVTSLSTAYSSLETVTAQLGDDIHANSLAITGLESGLGDVESGVSANAAALDTLETTVSGHEGEIAANATAIGQVQAEVDDNTAAVATKAEATVVTDLEGEVDTINAQYTIKVDANGRIAGLGLMSDGVTSQVGIVADQFWIAQPGSTNATPGSGDLLPFVVDVDGTYIAKAAIKDGSIETAKLGTLDVGELTVTGSDGSGAIASAIIPDAFIDMLYIADVLESADYSATEGWQILKSGAATFNNVKVRGDVAATSVEVGAEIISPLWRHEKTSPTDFANSGIWAGLDNGLYKLLLGDDTTFIQFDPDEGELIRFSGRMVGQDYEAGTSFTQHQNNTARSMSNDNFALLKDTRVARYGEANFLWEVRTLGESNTAGGNVSCESYWEFRRLRGGVETVIDAYDRFDSGLGDPVGGVPGFYDSGWISRSTNVDVIPDDHIRVYGRRDFSGSPTLSSGDAMARNLRLRLIRSFGEESIL